MVQTIDTETLVWCEPMERKDPRLRPTDIGHAIGWFREKTGCDPRLIMVHPSLEAMARENSNGIKIEAAGGVLAWEVWLSLADDFRPSPIARSPQTPEPPEKPQPVGTVEAPPVSQPPDAPQSKSGRDTTKSRGRILRTVPPNILSPEKIMRWHKQGLGTRTIAKRLNDQGISISYRTVARVISRQLQLPMEVNDEATIGS